jgi:hypothetical protein
MHQCSWHRCTSVEREKKEKKKDQCSWHSCNSVECSCPSPGAGHRMCSLTSNVFSYCRMCSLTVECVLSVYLLSTRPLHLFSADSPPTYTHTHIPLYLFTTSSPPNLYIYVYIRIHILYIYYMTSIHTRTHTHTHILDQARAATLPCGHVHTVPALQ